MFSRCCLSRGSNQWLRQASKNCRTMATTVAVPQVNPFKFDASEAGGIRIAARDDGGPTTSLALVVRAGSRYEPQPGLAHALSQFTWKNTERRSALRLNREVELLGGRVSTTLSRENIILNAQFFRSDLPFFIEAFGDIITSTRYQHHILDEDIAPTIKYELAALESNAPAKALENAHNIAFHKGLGSAKYAASLKHADPQKIAEYANIVYNKSNIALVASGASLTELSKWTGELLGHVKPGSALSPTPTSYYGGESQQFSSAGSSYVIAFRGSSSNSFKAEYKVLAHLLGGESAVKWSSGFSLLSRAVSNMVATSAVARELQFTDGGLLYITVTAPDRFLIPAGKAVVRAIKDVTHGDFKELEKDVAKARAQAKFDVYSQVEKRLGSLELIGQDLIATGKVPQVEEIVKAIDKVTVGSIRETVKSLTGEKKATLAAVGDSSVLPFAEDIGL